jgi:hypothetical protein
MDNSILAQRYHGTGLVQRLRQELSDRRFTLFSDSTFLGHPLQARSCLASRFSTELESDLPEVHPNRRRARDAFDYTRVPTGITLTRAESAVLTNKNGYLGSRHHKRINLLEDSSFRDLGELTLSAVPVREQSEQGIISFDLFRTYSTVTQKPHQDETGFVVIYCVTKYGEGAITKLTRDNQRNRVVFEKGLLPGEILMFSDKDFFHHTTQLPSVGTLHYRDAVVGLV